MLRHTIILLAMTIFACGHTDTADEEVPSALQDPSAVEELTGEVKSSFPRLAYGEDLVEKLFADVLEKDTALKSLLEQVDERYDQHGDTVQRYERFNALNDAYYTSAQQHAHTLKDSTERTTAGRAGTEPRSTANAVGRGREAGSDVFGEHNAHRRLDRAHQAAAHTGLDGSVSAKGAVLREVVEG